MFAPTMPCLVAWQISALKRCLTFYLLSDLAFTLFFCIFNTPLTMLAQRCHSWGRCSGKHFFPCWSPAPTFCLFHRSLKHLVRPQMGKHPEHDTNTELLSCFSFIFLQDSLAFVWAFSNSSFVFLIFP